MHFSLRNARILQIFEILALHTRNFSSLQITVAVETKIRNRFPRINFGKIKLVIIAVADVFYKTKHFQVRAKTNDPQRDFDEHNVKSHISMLLHKLQLANSGHDSSALC